MARNFDGANDRIQSTLDGVSNIDNTTVSQMIWFRKGVSLSGSASIHSISTLGSGFTGGNERARLFCSAPTTANDYRITSSYIWSTTNANRRSNDLVIDTDYAVTTTYDRSSSANVPTIYVNGDTSHGGGSQTAVGTAQTGSDSVRLGENSGGTQDGEGTMGFFVVLGSTASASDANRHRWWGMAPGGPSTMEVCLPLWTSDLNNKGTGGAITFTATGTTMTSMPKVERCWAATMGCGR